ncbi:DNA-processing protein DprA [Actinotalea sp. M2MS4P-6]|uniref:DNA-processing protein DprA n=1 Tax=Actinotalea sp. M2MS4P-6 TaxID=2983762 RepID=UPI0021E45415|nr:DNA-processing protein DprA [Actinotalea sp. M2MS4P-6]MCV2396095.1 DNA-processing protein DprA [Actinotalea sp. M2MS4P-6]
MNDLEARIAWSGLVEPGDPVAGALVESLGPVDALDLVARTARADAVLLPGLTTVAHGRVRRGLEGWAQRWGADTWRRHRDWIEALSGRVVVPGDPGWPAGLDDLGLARPMCLWVRGADPAPLLARAVSVVGSRAATSYGEHVTAELCAGLADADACVVSGGAFGIDAMAHRAALTADGGTVAVLAGGLDRPYPAANARLLSAVAEKGALLAEVPPGTAPTRHRFLLRNRLIAALGQVTVVVEAARRSGALSTAGHATALMRPVGAVPGPVTSAASSGCHHLLRDGAVCLTSAADVLELLDGTPADSGIAEPLLGARERIVLDALPVRQGTAPEGLTRPCGLALPEVLAALGTLELSGRAVRSAGRWRRA